METQMTQIKKMSTLRLLAVVSTLSFCAIANAQGTYPERPIKIIVPYPPGGTSDSVARLLANGLTERFGQAVVVDNRAGGGTMIGTNAVAKSPADGHTLLLTATPYAINSSLYKSMPYDANKDFKSVVAVAWTPMVLIVNAKSPFNSANDIIKAATSKPGTISYGSAGLGGGAHLTMENMQVVTNTKFNHIPYKGSMPAVLDLIGGQTDMVLDTLFLTQQQTRAGKARAIVQGGARRSKLMPDVPTLREAGLGNFDSTSWFVLLAPAGTPDTIIAKLNAASNDILSTPAVTKIFAEQGLETIGGTPEDASQFIKKEINHYSAIIKAAGVKAEE